MATTSFEHENAKTSIRISRLGVQKPVEHYNNTKAFVLFLEKRKA